MDPNRHHEFIGSNDERPSAMYFSRGGEDIRSHSQYFSPDRTVGSNKPCACSNVSGNILCNGCRTNAAGENWNAEHAQRVDFREADTRDKVAPGTMYVHNSATGGPYWQHSGAPYVKDLMPTSKNSGAPHLDRHVSNKSCALDTSHSYKHPQMQQPPPAQSNLPNPPNLQHQHHISAIGTYCKDRSYDDKYSAQHDLIAGAKIGYTPTASANTAAYNNVGHGRDSSVEAVRSTKHDRNVINPSNVMSLKEQHPSPNYARKCPQIFSPEEQNLAHHSLYMSTPRFSSDKFINVHSQKMTREQGRHIPGNSVSVSHLHSNPTDASKLNEMQMPSAPHYAVQPNYHHMNESSMQPQTVSQHQPPACGSNLVQSKGQVGYCAQVGKSHAHTHTHAPAPALIPEISPVIMTQTSTHYQYSKNAMPSSPSHMPMTKSTMRDVVDYKKKEEDMYNDHVVLSNRGLYVNPYNTPPSSDSCCKEIASPYTVSSNYHDGSPHNYYKYGKIVKETITANKLSAENRNTPPPSRASGFKGPMYFLDAQSMKYDGNLHSASSPAAATVASPSPSLLASQTQMHHNEYISQSQFSQPYHQQQHQIEMNRSVVRTPHENSSLSPYSTTFEQQVLQGPKVASFNTITSKSSELVMQPSQPVQVAPHLQSAVPSQVQNPKKSQIQKPNYRELINQAYARRNATSEEELNLQIIKKTLNVDPHGVRPAGATGAGGSATASIDKFQLKVVAPNSTVLVPVGSSVSGRNYACDNYRRENVATPTHTLAKQSADAVPDARRNIKQEDKLSPSPLDLSMRTVKTKADSTEYKYPHLAANPQVDYKYALPRVDFTPNFSLHTGERNVPTKSAVPGDRATYTSPEFRYIPSNGCPKLGQAQTHVQPQFSRQFLEESAVKANSTMPSPLPSCDTRQPPVAPHVSPIVPHTELQITTMKTATRAVNSINQGLEVCQVRPSVLETNPFAAVKTVKSEPKFVKENVIAVDQLPPETSIMALPKSNVLPGMAAGAPLAISGGVIKMAEQVSPVTTQSAYTLACERNPNYLGRKRHLQEYSNSKMTDTGNKQMRYQEPAVKSEYIRPAEITVITVNERAAELERIKTAEKSIQAEMPSCCPQTVSIITDSSASLTMQVCKTEPVTPTTDVAPLPTFPVKTEANSLIAARIRTKAELKGFTFNPPTAELSSPNESIKIKEEPLQESCVELPSIPGLNEEFSENNLLDCSWNNTCNNFVEQLLTSSKKKPTKRKLMNVIKTEISEDDLPVSTIAFKKDSVMSNLESAETSRSFSNSKVEGNDSTFTAKSVSQEAVISQASTAQKKISKQDREKIRLQQEKRIAARLQDETSSESGNELDKRKSERLKKPLKKIKNRTNTFSEKHRFSDCGSDSSDSENSSSSMKSSKQTHEQQSATIFEVLTPKYEKNDKAHVKNESGAERRKPEPKANKGSIKVNRANQSLSPVEGSNEDEGCPKVVKRLEKTQNTTDESQKRKSSENENSNRSKSEKEKNTNRTNISSKVGLNTMTRSKRKREMELQLANSKVLRNDKIIRNSTTKIRRKYVRKFVSNQNSSSCKEASPRHSDEVMTMRLRSKNEKTSSKIGKNLEYKNDKSKKYAKSKNEPQNSKAAQNMKGKERQADLLMEVYRYKRSLKVPPSLITIDHPPNHKMAAASLPDLERDPDEMLELTNQRRRVTKMGGSDKMHTKSSSVKRKALTSSQVHPRDVPLLSEEPRSIIDVLHSRVLSSNVSTKPKYRKNTNHSTTSVHAHSETSQNTESNSVNEMLPSLKKEDEEESNDGKKRHFSIFETKVLQTKTRTESKLQQRKEIIREIFVGDDRPASAPPEISQASDGGEKMTYEQKYEQFLQQLNIVNINDDKLRKFRKGTTSATTTFSISASISTSTPVTEHTIKQEDDTESASAIDADEKLLDIDSREKLSYASSSNFRRRRPGKYLRRKGSSGFDYIRKKKKPTSSVGASHVVHHSQVLGRLLKLEDLDELKTKSESDVCREIQKWVLNKSVGQSTMHKAARLGYIDVVVYCLDRMGLNPDQKDNAGYTPLHEACTKGWLEIARVLLQYGANHSEAAHSGIRPLHEASENDHDEIVRLLLSYGADPLLATYSGQTPLMLASSTAMRNLLNNYLSDVQNVGPDRKPWYFNGPWEILDMTKCGYDIFGGAPNFTCDMSRALRKSSVSSLITNKKQFNQYGETSCKTVMDKCAVLLDNIDRFNSVRLYNDNKPEFLVENSDSEGEIFEFEEADVLLPPLYLLKDEGSEKWVLLSDLCNLLKVKSKDTLLNKIYPSSSSVSSAHKSLMRELKMSDFLEKATCLQLLCAGEKINICASKVVLIKYNDSVRNLLGVKTILMKF